MNSAPSGLIFTAVLPCLFTRNLHWAPLIQIPCLSVAVTKPTGGWKPANHRCFLIERTGGGSQLERWLDTEAGCYLQVCVKVFDSRKICFTTCWHCYHRHTHITANTSQNNIRATHPMLVTHFQPFLPTQYVTMTPKTPQTYITTHHKSPRILHLKIGANVWDKESHKKK